MKKLFFAAWFLFIQLSLFCQTTSSNYFDGKIYLRLKNNKQNNLLQKLGTHQIPVSKFDVVSSLGSKYGIQSISRPFFAADDCPELQNTYLIKFSKFSQVDDFISEISKNSAVEFAEKVPLMKLDYTPNDPSYSTQQWYLNKINAASAWNFFHGNSSVTVAVVDNAVQTSHTDLLANLWSNPNETANNGIDDDNNGFVDDMIGYDVADNDNNPAPPNNTYDHGTHCAGLVAARTDNNTGIAAIGFNLKIISVKASSSTGSASAVDAGFAGIIYAVKAGARVISCSWGGNTSATTEQTVINYAWNKKSIVVAAAGNSNVNAPHYPAAYNNCYAVASTTSTDAKSSFSNYGSWVDISAPGSSIYSTLPTNTYGNKSGTSMATPIVAGLCGLMYALKPYSNPSDILNCINSSATNINSQNPNFIGSLGAGRIDANAAMQCVSGVSAPLPTVDFIAQKTTACIGTPIQFFDQTYINANSWSWSFPGGTPSNSSVKNPVVSYPAAGTYPVTLTATNPNGSNSITKNAYINITIPSNLPLQEGFVSGTFPPSNWVLNDFFLDSVTWQKSNTIGGFGNSTQSAFFDNYNYDSQGRPEEIWTPKYNFSNLSSSSLSFDVAYARYDATYSDTLQVLVSTDCGQTFNSIYLKGGTTLSTAPDNTAAIFTPTNTQWRTESISLNSYLGQSNVLITFRNKGHYGQAIYLDNININGVANGAPPIALFSNAQNICSGVSTSFTDQSSNAPNAWNWTVSPSAGVSISSTTTQNPQINFNSAGNYTVSLVSSNSFGNSAAYSQTISVGATPNVTATAPNTNNCQGTPTTITASGANSYSWSNGSSNSFITVNPNTSTSYTVSGTLGACSDTASIFITIKPLPIAAISGAGTICAGDSLQLTASGGVSYLWSSGTNPNNGSTVTVTPSVTTQFTVTVTGSNGCSKNATSIVSVNPLPILSVNNPTICPGTSVVLTANGANSYTWSNGSVGSSISVSPSSTSTYTVTGIGVGNCSSQIVSTVNLFTANGINIIQNSDSLIANPLLAGNYSYQWGTNGQVTIGDTLPYIIPQQNGTYFVQITDQNGCTVSDTFTINNVGIKSINITPKIVVFPNPFVSEVFISIATDFMSGGFISVIDATGKTILYSPVTEGKMKINTQEWSPSTYLILYKSEDGNTMSKSVIKLKN